jgi:hypothetical protein
VSKPTAKTSRRTPRCTTHWSAIIDSVWLRIEKSGVVGRTVTLKGQIRGFPADYAQSIHRCPYHWTKRNLGQLARALLASSAASAG